MKKKGIVKDMLNESGEKTSFESIDLKSFNKTQRKIRDTTDARTRMTQLGYSYNEAFKLFSESGYSDFLDFVKNFKGDV